MSEKKQIDQLAGFTRILGQVQSHIVFGPSEINDCRQHNLIEQQQEERTWHSEVDQQFALQDRVFEQVHEL